MQIGIIGGGITGLSTALALQKFGFSSVIFEQAKEFNEVGAGIWVQPNAIKVFNWLGIGEHIKQKGIELDSVEITDSQLVPLKKMKRGVVHDNMIIAIHRAELQKVLVQEVKKNTQICMGKKYVSHEINDKGVTIKFEEGSKAVDLLLGADGINSQVRELIVPSSKLRNAGQICWRGIAQMDLPDALKHSGKEAWGNQIRFGFSQIATGKVYWFAVVKQSQFNESEMRDRKEIVANFFNGFSPIVSKLIAHTNPHDIHEAVLHDLKRISTWHKDKVCLLGDAAHATTPNMGQGACQGIEDSYYISKFLFESKARGLDAFKQLEKQRMDKVNYVVNTSWRFGKMAHSFFGQSIMKLLLKLTPENVIQKQMNKLYHVDL
ncbi:MAG: FAD-dependent monooxygenase [Flavobacteriales bacterium]|nr:FAD-dependent monooxygenase [Flavobacteriales bacterium]